MAVSHSQRSIDVGKVSGIAGCALSAAILTCFVFLTTQARGQNATSVRAVDSEMRLRFAWGSGAATSWSGRISVEPGRLSDLRLLGSDRDVASSMHLQQDAVEIHSERAHNYQAMDVTVSAPSSARLQIRLVKQLESDRQELKVVRIPLVELITGEYNQTIDDDGNRLFVQRVPGDSLRVEHARDHLVFSPGERWPIEIKPHLPEVATSDRLRMQLRVVPARGQQTIWREEKIIRGDVLGAYQSVGNLVVPIPPNEGVYELVIRLGAVRNRNLFRSGGDTIERRVQFVVIDSRPTAGGAEEQWRESFTFDPSQPQWLERLSRIPRWEQLSFNPMKLIGKGSAKATSLDGRRFSRLEPGQSHSYPMPVYRTGEPHLLEVTYPASRPQSLAVRISEGKPDDPDSLVTDTAMIVEEKNWDTTDRTCRIIFWPRTRVPRVELTNLSTGRAAHFGRIRLLDGPRRLSGEVKIAQHGNRTAMLRLDQPGLHQVLGATLATDHDSGRRLTDWATFLDAATRLAEFLRHAGYDGATIPCYASGSAIAPMPALLPNTRFDTGAFLTRGEDLESKDVVEMLLRIFDREGLRLNLSLTFDAPIPALEAIRHSTSATASHSEIHGLELIDVDGRHAANDLAKLSRYNVLNKRVQSAVLNPVVELARRYGSHPSFVGITIECRDETCTHLPGLQWGYDPSSLKQFRDTLAGNLAEANGEKPRSITTRGRVAAASVGAMANRTTK